MYLACFYRVPTIYGYVSCPLGAYSLLGVIDRLRYFPKKVINVPTPLKKKKRSINPVRYAMDHKDMVGGVPIWKRGSRDRAVQREFLEKENVLF